MLCDCKTTVCTILYPLVFYFKPVHERAAAFSGSFCGKTESEDKSIETGRGEASDAWDVRQVLNLGFMLVLNRDEWFPIS